MLLGNLNLEKAHVGSVGQHGLYKQETNRAHVGGCHRGVYVVQSYMNRCCEPVS